MEAVTSLITAGADVNVVIDGVRLMCSVYTSCSDGWYTLLVGAIVLCAVSVITQMYGYSVLNVAAVRGNVKVVSLLLEAGADIDHQNNMVHVHTFLPSAITVVVIVNSTVEPPIKDTPNKEHLSIKDNLFTRLNSYYTSTLTSE